MAKKFCSLANTIIAEARKDDLVYVEKQARGALDSVVTKVDGALASKIESLVVGLQETRQVINEYIEKNNQLTDEAKALSLDFFDEDDKVLTRVITTEKACIKFSKVVPKVETKEVKDYKKLQALVKEIAGLIRDQQSDVCAQIRKMIANCDYIATVSSTKVPAEKVLTGDPVIVEGKGI